MPRPWIRTGALLALLTLASCGTPLASPTPGAASRPLSPTATVASSAAAVTPTRPSAPQTIPVTPATPRPVGTPIAAPSPTPTPVVIIANRDAITLELRLQKTTFAAGEGGPAILIVRNTGPAPVLLLGGCTWASVTVLDEHGQMAQLPVWFSGAISCPQLQRPLDPGAEESTTLWFQVPPDSAGRHYSIQAGAGLGTPPSPDGNITNGPPLTTQPVPLTITAPTPDQYLRTTLETDRAGWRLVATHHFGHNPPKPPGSKSRPRPRTP
ncbi:MAG: hypothetical protein U0841_21720 [Chloroflexia bacterium]